MTKVYGSFLGDRVRERWVIGLVVLIVTLVSASFLHDRPLYFSDSLVYMEGAQSIAEGRGYSIGGAAHTAWPPGYSAALSPLYAMLGLKAFAFKLFNVVCSGLALAFACALFGHERPYAWLGLGAAAVTGLFFPWIYYTHAILADILFCLLVFGFLWQAGAYIRTGKRACLVAMTCIGMFVPLVRMAGIALFPVWLVAVVSEAMKKRSRERWIETIAMGLLLVLPLVLWSLRNMAVAGNWTSIQTGVTPEYTASLLKAGIEDVSFLTGIKVNAIGYLHIWIARDQSALAQAMELPWWLSICCAVFWVVVAVGWGLFMMRQVYRPACLLCFFYGGILVLHNWYSLRYLVPILPLIFFFMLIGARQLTAWMLRCLKVPQRKTVLVSKTCVGVITCGLLLGNIGVLAFSEPARNLRSDTYTGVAGDLYAACQYLEEAGKDGSVLSASGGFTGVWSGRDIAVVHARLGEDGGIADEKLPDDLAFVLYAEEDFAGYNKKYLKPWVEENRERLEVVFRQGSVMVYRVVD